MKKKKKLQSEKSIQSFRSAQTDWTEISCERTDTQLHLHPLPPPPPPVAAGEPFQLPVTSRSFIAGKASHTPAERERRTWERSAGCSDPCRPHTGGTGGAAEPEERRWLICNKAVRFTLWSETRAVKKYSFIFLYLTTDLRAYFSIQVIFFFPYF